MAISTTPATVPTIDQIVLKAFKRAGLLPIEYGIGTDTHWAAKAAHGRDLLNTILASASTERFFEYFVQHEFLTVVANTNEYTLSADVLNVMDDGSFIPSSNGAEVEKTTGETPVRPLSGFRWNQLSSKASLGTPVFYYLERNAENLDGALQLRLWPVPSEAGQIRFRTHRIPGSSSTGSDNPDFKRHWERWAILALAYDLMADSSMPLEERAMTRTDRDLAFEKLKSYDTNNTPPDLVFMHSTPWSGRSL